MVALRWAAALAFAASCGAAMNMTGIPACGVKCLVRSLSGTACALGDQTCLCADHDFADRATACVLANCTVRESLVTKNHTTMQCSRPITDNTAKMVILSAVFVPLQSIFFVARLTAKFMKLTSWGHDDTTITIAYVFVMGSIVLNELASRNGLGRDIWTLTPNQITAFLQAFFASELLYIFNLAMVKISIVFFYLRIFPGRAIRWVLWGTQFFNILLGFTFLIVGFVQCTPLNFFWERWDGEHEGSCMNLNAMAWSHAALNIALDIWILILPASQIYGMNIAPQKKAQILVIFGFGVLLTVVSIVRLKSLLTFGDSRNVTAEYWPISVWSKLELTFGIICACLPAARQAFAKALSGLFKWPRTMRSNTKGSAPRPDPVYLSKSASPETPSRNTSRNTSKQSLISRPEVIGLEEVSDAHSRRGAHQAYAV